jgi:hypothetical protein
MIIQRVILASVLSIVAILPAKIQKVVVWSKILDIFFLMTFVAVHKPVVIVQKKTLFWRFIWLCAQKVVILQPLND